MRWLLLAVVAPAIAGCSLIYNPSNLPEPRMIDAPSIDANACAVVVDSIAPSIIDEGQGDGGSAPALVVVHGNNFVNTNLEVELKAPDGVTVHLEPITDAVASRDTTFLAFTVTARVDTALTTDVPLEVIVTQDCLARATLSGQLTLHGLTELTTLPASTAMLKKKYSRVTLSDVTFAGTAPAEITAVSSIMLGKVDAAARNATAGPGGAGGGATQGGGPCGGGLGESVTGLGLGGGGGGGGAGYVEPGKPGDKGTLLGGGAGGGAGQACGDDMLVSSATDRASAGGAGGSGNVSGAAAGGVGGGGGGSVLLTAGGNLTVGDILANGGAGEDRNSSGGGGGGGGAGGTVLVSTATGTLSVGTIRAGGGPMGSPNGGNGAAGRVRWDAPDGAAPASPDTPARRGPAFTTRTRVVTSLPQAISLVGTPDHTFNARVIDRSNMSHDAGQGVFDPLGMAVITPKLYEGYNRICVILDGGSPGTIGERCMDMAFLP